MLHAPVFDMPVKTSLKLMTSVRSDRADPERKLFDHVVHELERTFLVMGWKDLQCPNPRGIIDGCRWIPFHALSRPIF